MSKFENETHYVKFLEGCGHSWRKNASFEAGHEQGYAEGYKDGMEKGLELLAERNRLAPQVPQIELVEKRYRHETK